LIALQHSIISNLPHSKPSLHSILLLTNNHSALERQKEALEEEKLDAIEEAKEKEKMFEAKLNEERAAIALKGM
jgi:hypothetical protein